MRKWPSNPKEQKVRVIDIPEAIITDQKNEDGTDAKFSFKDFLDAALRQYKPYGTWDKMDRAVIVKKSIKEMNSHLRLEDSDYDDVLVACKTVNFNPAVNEHFMPFKKAILDAQKVSTPTGK